MAKIKLNKRNVDGIALSCDRQTVWDTDLAGFGLRISPSGEKVYLLKYRFSGRQRFVTIGRHGSPWTPDLARDEARRLLGQIVGGHDPAEKRYDDRRAMTFAELADLYLREGAAHKKSSTIKTDRARIKHHLKPLLGRKKVNTITRADVERLLIDVTNASVARRSG